MLTLGMRDLLTSLPAQTKNSICLTVSCRNGDEFTEESELDKHTCLYLVRGILTLNEVEWEGVVEHAHFLCEDVDDPIEFEYDNINDVE